MLIPSATYRLQFSKDFNFRQAFSLIGYLSDLGISTVYASPILQAFPGSNHGYDVTDFNQLNPELGTMEDLQALVEGLREKSISWIQDIVPNHMNFSPYNQMLWDVLKNGQGSSYASCFDIDWEHPLFGHRLGVPLLNAPLNDIIQAGGFQLTFVPAAGFSITYGTLAFPLNTESTLFLLTGYFPFDPQKDMDATRLRLASLSRDHALIQTLLSEQHYLLTPYYSTDREINYRRFFAINSLITLRMEDEKIFNVYHRLTKELFDKGWIQGLRIDHIDGLKDPKTYVDRLRATFGPACYIMVEKILEIKEELPAHFDIQGTSGYEFISYINQLLTDKKGSASLVRFYNEIVPGLSDYPDITFYHKYAFLKRHFNGEWNSLVRLLMETGLMRSDAGVQPSEALIKEALGVFMACFPIYRIYISLDTPSGFAPLDDHSRRWVRQAFDGAARRAPHLQPEWDLFSALFELAGDGKDPLRGEFLQRFMQFTAPLEAKGVEDTSFYCYNPLISHNEVGDSPCELSISPARFHEKMLRRRFLNALSLNCTSTHDTKRGEDMRTRINMISGFSDEWPNLVRNWQTMNGPLKTWVKGTAAPTVNDEYFIYQSVLGAFPETGHNDPFFSQRTKEYMRKALRESGMNTSHTKPDLAYEGACFSFIDRLFDPVHPFTRTLIPFLHKVLKYAYASSLSSVVIKSTAPGIPDFYQGSELWDLSYVDPDNRKPVDFVLRRKMMNEMKEAEASGPAALKAWLRSTQGAGGQKMFVTYVILHLRKRCPDLFLSGAYIPLPVPDPDSKILAYARVWEGKWIIVIVPLGASSQGTPAVSRNRDLPLPEGCPTAWLNVFTGKKGLATKGWLPESILADFPVAVLESIC